MAKNAQHAGLTAARRATCLAQMAETGVLAHAAESCGVSEATVRLWMKTHPDFDEAMRGLAEQVAQRMGQKALNVAEQHLDACLSGKPMMALRRKDGVRNLKGGGQEVVTMYEEIPIEANPLIVKLGLTRLDPRFTHPKQELSVDATVATESLAERLARLEAEEKAADAATTGEDHAAHEAG